MMLLLFLLLFFTVMVAWLGNRRMALSLFSITFVLSILNFLHHVNTHLSLQL